MTKFELQSRTKAFHIDVIKLCGFFPKNAAGYEIAKRLIRAAGSVGANYRAVCRAKSTADFVYKLEIVLEEADESLYWLEVVHDVALVEHPHLIPLMSEANELVSIFNKADLTAKRNKPVLNHNISKSQNQK